MYRTSYKVIIFGDKWVIEAYEDSSYTHVLDIEFTDKEIAEKICKILNEETEEAYSNGQMSTY